MEVKEDFFSRSSLKVGTGVDTKFWEDIWLGNKFLAHKIPISLQHYAAETSFYIQRS
jgi:hypothetical protein